MRIRINGEPADMPDGLTVAGLIEQLKMTGQRLALELNGEVVPRSRWPETLLADGDQTEIVRAIGGG
jgi:sulfur carrier protein